MQVLGIDIGGSKIKGAVVDVESGKLLTERIALRTPKKADVKAVQEVVLELVESFSWEGPIGCGFPGIVKNQKIYSGANLHTDWKNSVPFAEILKKASGCPCYLLNDADAAGLAEVRYGAGKDIAGSLLMITVGTGLGSALFYDGTLFPNTEFGHILIDGIPAEKRASGAVLKKEQLSWSEWTSRINIYFEVLEPLISPDLIILGGGIVKNWDSFNTQLKTKAPITPAIHKNLAGIIGAACSAQHLS